MHCATLNNSITLWDQEGAVFTCKPICQSSIWLYNNNAVNVQQHNFTAIVFFKNYSPKWADCGDHVIFYVYFVSCMGRGQRELSLTSHVHVAKQDAFSQDGGQVSAAVSCTFLKISTPTALISSFVCIWASRLEDNR